MATGTQDQKPNALQPFINLGLLLLAGGVITVLLLVPVLLIAENSPILGLGWFAAAAAVGAVFGLATFTQTSNRLLRAPATLAVIIGVLTLLSVLGIIFNFDL